MKEPWLFQLIDRKPKINRCKQPHLGSSLHEETQARAVICWPVTIKILAKTASSVSDNTRSVYKAVSTIDGSEPCQNLTRHQIWCSRIDTPSTRRPSSCYKAKHQQILPYDVVPGSRDNDRWLVEGSTAADRHQKNFCRGKRCASRG